MENVTEFLREKGLAHTDLIHNFLKMERVKYLIASGEKVVAIRGKYGGTSFSPKLFTIFVNWMEKKPIPLLNRKEYEVNDFIQEIFRGKVIKQYKLNGFVYDWYVPSLDLLVEFNEKIHETSRKIKANDKAKARPNLFVIHEETVMKDLANLARQILSPQ